MSSNWREDVPIFKQIKDKMVDAILEGALADGDSLPSVRQVAVQMQVNPLTVQRAYGELADEGIIEKRRGLGMYVNPGVKGRLLDDARHQFLANEWPEILSKIEKLGLSLSDLANAKPAKALMQKEAQQ